MNPSPGQDRDSADARLQPHTQTGAHAHPHGHDHERVPCHELGHDHHHDHDAGSVRGQGHELAVHRGGGADAVCFESVSFSYPRRGVEAQEPVAAALRDVTLHVPQGSRLGIIGPNGAGKSTLLRLMLGLLTGHSGRIEVCGLSPHAARRRGDLIGYVPQRPQVEWRFPLTARQVVLMGLTGKTGLFRRHSAEDRGHADRVMERVGIADLARTPIGDLSGGQQQRVLIARALASRPRLLVLDEPLVGVDEVGQRRFAELIADLHRALGLTLVIVSHDLRAIAAGCDRVACLRQTIHYHDTPQGLTDRVLQEVFRHDIAPLRVLPP